MDIDLNASSTLIRDTDMRDASSAIENDSAQPEQSFDPNEMLAPAALATETAQNEIGGADTQFTASTPTANLTDPVGPSGGGTVDDLKGSDPAPMEESTAMDIDLNASSTLIRDTDMRDARSAIENDDAQTERLFDPNELLAPAALATETAQNEIGGADTQFTASTPTANLTDSVEPSGGGTVYDLKSSDPASVEKLVTMDIDLNAFSTHRQPAWQLKLFKTSSAKLILNSPQLVQRRISLIQLNPMAED
ncbi:MAG: hypothetical protein M1826_000340 [Phylliscum demangeonii]|nr:MAG: hypothetical protein M1826_000340 [Phylliscum demangeonii]